METKCIIKKLNYNRNKTMQVFKEKNYGYCLLKQLILIVFGQVIILHHVFSQQQPVIAEQLVESAISQHDESETEDDGPVQQL